MEGIQIAGVPDRHEPDGGEVHFPHLFDRLDQLGYTGFIGCEYRPKAGTSAGLGWLLSLFLGNAPLLIGAGALLGMFLSLYLIHRRLEATTPGKDQAVPDRATRILRGHRRGTS